MELNLHVLQSPGFSVHETLKGGGVGGGGGVRDLQLPESRS